MSMHPLVSIIIPVYNDVDRLKICLTALENQTYSKSDYEVIVVDNNSEEDIKFIVEQYSQAKLVCERQRGSYAARNKGLSLAKGTHLGFTDSDCIPALNWIEKGVERLLESSGCGFVAGKIDLFFQNLQKPTTVELFDSFNFLNQHHYVQENKFGATANLFTTRSIFDAVGLFNAELKSGGDKEWGQRVHSAGYAQIYADDVCIAHPARTDLSELKKKVARITEGHFSIENQNERSLTEFLREIYWDLKPSFRGFYKIFADDRLKSIEQKISYSTVYQSLRFVRARKKIELYFKDRRFVKSN